jgi:hypothetical protein
MSRDASPARTSSRKTRSGPPGAASPKEYPMREYIGAMCLELAQMARWDDDERLAVLLEAAAGRAHEPAPVRAVMDSIERIVRSA